jgi:hypothetical protein
MQSQAQRQLLLLLLLAIARTPAVSCDGCWSQTTHMQQQCYWFNAAACVPAGVPAAAAVSSNTTCMLSTPGSRQVLIGQPLAG